MEKEQNTNSDKQNKEAEDKINEEQNNDAQTIIVQILKTIKKR